MVKMRYFLAQSARSILLFALVMSSFSSFGAILWDTQSGKSTKSRFDYDRTDEAKKVSSFWFNRKMSAGMGFVGVYGLAGGQVGIHFHPQWSVDLGFGGGSHFQSFGFRVKKLLLLSSPLNPYIGVGFQRWQRTTTRPISSASISPGYVANQFMSAEEKRLGLIDQRLLHGTLGLQYIFTNGSWAGYGLYIEAIALLSVDDFDSAPTASMGFNYYF